MGSSPGAVAGRERENMAESKSRGAASKRTLRAWRRALGPEREKSGFLSHWGDGKRSCPIFELENKSEPARNNVTSPQGIKSRPWSDIKSTTTHPPGSQDPPTSLAHWAGNEHITD